MKKPDTATVLTLWINRFVALLVGVLLFTLPSLLDWYAKYREMGERGEIVVTAAFYCCAVFIGGALWFMDGLLRAILKGDVFVKANVQRIRRIRLCCGIVSGICLPAAIAYPPLVFLTVIMGFLCLVVSVVARVMDAAVAIREENDLTV